MAWQGGGQAGGQGDWNWTAGGGETWNSQLPVMEGQLSHMANQVYDDILNLNVTPGDVRGKAEATFSLRDQILDIYGVDASAGGVTAPAGGGLLAGGIEAHNFKGRLTQLLSKRAKKSAEKGDVMFDIVEAPGGGFVATCSGALLDASYTGEACPGKKASEHAAAKVTIAAMFPDVPLGLQPAEVPRGKKRRREETTGDEDMEPKVKMVRFMQLVLGRSTTKTDIVFDTVQDPLTKGYVTTLSLLSHSGKVFTSDTCPSKKAAEADASSKGLAEFADDMVRLEQEHQEKKKTKNRDALAALALKMKEKKERQALGLAVDEVMAAGAV